MFKKKPKSTSEVVAQFEAMIDDLGFIAEARNEEVEKQTAIIEEARLKSEASKTEYYKALTVAGKIKGLIG
jgi:hypothetical protein